ncbi:transcriptional regulator [Leptospira biflexa]|uniref:PAS domain-containing protein n=1 Tax=Leptospira biflexa TaxID=172 RepID=UPI00109122EF|nr:PAS domain-containing protein [Leptospira biflexa]TGM47939.1 transcriptional regulator [Leptospira biflexa]TGM49596.1 transcriptional regulator [Leptospira biflexa]
MKFESLYRHFLLTRATHIPVTNEKGDLVGLLSKDRVHRELSDLGKEREDLDQIPIDILETELNESVILYFKETSLIPVIGLDGEKKETWDKPRFLAAFTKLESKQIRDPKLDSIETKLEKKKENLDSIQWFMELILSHFPDGLIATDVTGGTIFYNESFEKDILTKSLFDDSIETAEKYLHNLNREVLASYLKEHDLSMGKEADTNVLTTMLPDLQSQVRIITLKKEKKVVGFLYHFARSVGGFGNGKGKSEFPDLDLAFHSKLPLETVLAEMEAHYIHKSLQRNSQNISHAASELGIPRTTLQNRIRFLNLAERFQNNQKERVVIPRKRSEKQVAPEKKPLPKKGQSKKQSSLPKKKSKNTQQKPLKSAKQTIPTEKKQVKAKKGTQNTGKPSKKAKKRR